MIHLQDTPRLLVKMEFGSHLYGTATENSDRDYKGVFVPHIIDCLLDRIKPVLSSSTKITNNIKNNATDVDSDLYSIQKFLFDLGASGETVFLDMIHAPEDCIITNSDEWRFLQKHRAKFYTKNLKSYIGYCKTQAAKYGIRGSKLEECQKLLTYLQSFPEDTKFGIVFDGMPQSDYSKIYLSETAQTKDKKVYEFCGKKFLSDTNIYYIKECLLAFFNSYGARAKLAAENKGIDWKAISHAFRVGLQLKELYETGDLKFPLKEAPFLTDLKLGKYHFVNDQLDSKLSKLITEVEILALKSNYPTTVDCSFWEEWIMHLYWKF